MPFLQRFRIPAVLCALAVLSCLLLSRPYAETGICDDFSYIYTARHIANTGHIVYVGWAGAMLGWQVYVAAALFKLFGFSFTVARVTTWISAAATAFLLQRILVRCGASERNAVVAALSFALSPVFFMLSSSFMTDVEGLLAIVVCLYGCLRALQADLSRASVAWIVTAVVANAVLGTCRQVAWLGVLVLVPSTLWLLRTRRRVVLAGVLAIVVAGIFMLLAVHWFQQQPYTIGETVAAGVALPSRGALLTHMFRELVAGGLELPLLMLPLTAIFLPQVFRGSRRAGLAAALLALAYAAMALHWRHSHPEYLFEPTTGNWLGQYGYIEADGPRGHGPVLLPLVVRALLTLAAVGGVLGLLVLLTRRARPQSALHTEPRLSSSQLAILLLPYTLVYAVLLIPRSVTELFDRYLIGLLLLPLIFLVRLYQARVGDRLPFAAIALLGLMAAFSVSCVHNSFAQARAEIKLDHQLQEQGLNEDSVDFGWSYNAWIELQRFGHIDNPAIRFPANAFVPVPATVDPACYTPPVLFRYLRPEYGVSFDPNLCRGKAPFAPVSYTTWPTGQPAALYVVNYTPLPRQ